MDEVNSKEPSRGVAFMDTRYSPVKFLTTDDDRGYEKGSLVFVGGESKVYGPYQLDMEIGRGNGKVHWKAFQVGTGPARTKPLTKEELEKENASLVAKLATLQAQQQPPAHIPIAKDKGGKAKKAQEQTAIATT